MQSQQSAPAGTPCIAIPGDQPLLCRQCGSLKAQTEFRRRRTGGGGRVRQCRACHAYAERLRRYGKRCKEHTRRMRLMLSEVRRARSQRELETTCRAMLTKLGGPEGFMAAWIRQAEVDLAKGGLAGFRHLDALMQLLLHCEQMQDGRRHSAVARLRAMSDAELEAESTHLSGGLDPASPISP